MDAVVPPTPVPDLIEDVLYEIYLWSDRPIARLLNRTSSRFRQLCKERFEKKCDLCAGSYYYVSNKDVTRIPIAVTETDFNLHLENAAGLVDTMHARWKDFEMSESANTDASPVSGSSTPLVFASIRTLVLDVRGIRKDFGYSAHTRSGIGMASFPNLELLHLILADADLRNASGWLADFVTDCSPTLDCIFIDPCSNMHWSALYSVLKRWDGRVKSAALTIKFCLDLTQVKLFELGPCDPDTLSRVKIANTPVFIFHAGETQWSNHGAIMDTRFFLAYTRHEATVPTVISRFTGKKLCMYFRKKGTVPLPVAFSGWRVSTNIVSIVLRSSTMKIIESVLAHCVCVRHAKFPGIVADTSFEYDANVVAPKSLEEVSLDFERPIHEQLVQCNKWFCKTASVSIVGQRFNVHFDASFLEPFTRGVKVRMRTTDLPNNSYWDFLARADNIMSFTIFKRQNDDLDVLDERLCRYIDAKRRQWNLRTEQTAAPKYHQSVRILDHYERCVYVDLDKITDWELCRINPVTRVITFPVDWHPPQSHATTADVTEAEAEPVELT